MQTFHRIANPIITFLLGCMLLLAAAHLVARAQASPPAQKPSKPLNMSPAFMNSVVIQKARVERIAAWHSNRRSEVESFRLHSMLNSLDAAVLSGDGVMVLFWLEELRKVESPSGLTS